MKLLNKETLKIGKSVLVIMLGIVVTGAILDELGKGRLGALPRKLAEKVTKGYGV